MFQNGIVDEQFIYRKIQNKNQIFREITLLRKALKPYKSLLGDHSPTERHAANRLPVRPAADKRSKHLYNAFIEQKQNDQKQSKK